MERGGGAAELVLVFVMSELGRVLIVLGGVVILAGVLLLVFGRLHLPMGRLPGDIIYRGKNTTFYFPLAT